MENTRPSELLESQHRRIDTGIESIVAGTGPLSGLAESLALLRHHIYVEHEILFPPLEKVGLVMPVLVMKREHGQMWPLIDGLGASCESGSPADALRDPCRELLLLLQKHNPKEEQILYTAADRLEAERADGSLTKALAAGRMPEGWVCPTALH
ncbi:MAG TPA: hemerythrin domain-containing protein [Casimicrobiaceae bacterium]